MACINSNKHMLVLTHYPTNVVSKKMAPVPWPSSSYSFYDLAALEQNESNETMHEPPPPNQSSTSTSNVTSSNYNVLLMPREAEERFRFTPGTHVGNHRFQILLSLFRQRYLQADANGDEKQCKSIAQEVIDTLYNKCVPNGRFYEQGSDAPCQELQLGPTTVALIQDALKNQPNRPYTQVCRRIVSSGSISCYDSEEEATTMPNRFDVILNTEWLQLKHDCIHTGNNRLKVMLDMRMELYKKSNIPMKREIGAEVVASIMDEACSRFLEVDETSGMFKPISRELAVICMKNCFDTNADGDERHLINQHQVRQSEAKMLVARKRKKNLLGKYERLTTDAYPPGLMSPQRHSRKFIPKS